MNAYAVIFAVSVTTGFVLALLVGWAGRRLGVVDVPDGFRKVHGRTVPLLGGVAIFGAFFVSLFLAPWLSGNSRLGLYLQSVDCMALFGGAAAVLLVGVWDDVWGLRVRWKLLILSAVAVAMYVSGYRIGGVSNPFGDAINLGVFALPVTLFWFLGCMNAINLMDGLDGLAAGVTLFAAATLFVTSVLFHNVSGAILSIALAGSTLGFLALNFYPASIFLGDSGSLLLGFLIACVGLRGSEKSYTVVALLIPVIALGLPIADTALAILRRWTKALPMSVSDRQHIHHKLLEMGLSHRHVVLLIYAGCIMLAALALLMAAANSLQAAAVLTVLGLLTWLAVRVIGRHEIKLLKQRLTRYARRKKRGTECRTAAYTASTMMRHAQTVGAMWDIFSDAAEAMELDQADLALFAAARSHEIRAGQYRWNRNGDGFDYTDHDDLWSASLPLAANGSRLGMLRAFKATNSDPLGPEIPETLALLSKALAINIERVQGSALPRRKWAQQLLF